MNIIEDILSTIFNIKLNLSGIWNISSDDIIIIEIMKVISNHVLILFLYNFT